ncbi:MAG TPA: LEA type 2 family protein [Usitatibacter sp.]|jgi:LEA14-like dessication related protein|nr:LEA type 2 family protein [Usitatibacter sp.]
MPRLLPVFRIVAATSLLAACALMPGRDPLQVNVADVESVSGEGFEFRMLVKLRVQNPNDAPVEYDGVYLKLDVLDKTFASGVSDERGVVPRFGEALITVPVTVSTLNLVRQTLGMMIDGKRPEKLSYRLEGKLNGPMFGSTRFHSQGELPLDATPQ